MTFDIYACVPECEGCALKQGTPTDSTCKVCYRPYAKWHKLGGCEFATHRQRNTEPAQKQRVGQQKQRKKK